MADEGEGSHEGSSLHHAGGELRFIQFCKRPASYAFLRLFVLFICNILQAKAGSVLSGSRADRTIPSEIMPRDSDGEVAEGGFHGGERLFFALTSALFLCIFARCDGYANLAPASGDCFFMSLENLQTEIQAYEQQLPELRTKVPWGTLFCLSALAWWEVSRIKVQPSSRDMIGRV